MKEMAIEMQDEQRTLLEEAPELAAPAAEPGSDEAGAPPREPLADGLEAGAAFAGESRDTDESAEPQPLPQLQAEFRRLVAPLAAFTKVRPGDPRALERLDAALKRLPPGEALAGALEELRERTARYVEQARRERIAAFRPIEAEYVRAAREQGKQLRERASGWRIDLLELQLQREQARARFLYNREVLVPWSPINNAEDLAQLEGRARAMLERATAAYPDDLLARVFWDAYEQERARRRPGRGARPEAVPLLDFYRGLRVALVRHELEEQQPDKKLRYAELPRWTFLYNLDRYRALGAAVPEARRLGYQTGSQQESRTIGVVVNGLDAQQDYKTMCYIMPVQAARAGS